MCGARGAARCLLPVVLSRGPGLGAVEPSAPPPPPALSACTAQVEALIQGELKLILTPVGAPLDEAIWTGPQYPNASSNMSAWVRRPPWALPSIPNA